GGKPDDNLPGDRTIDLERHLLQVERSIRDRLELIASRNVSDGDIVLTVLEVQHDNVINVDGRVATTGAAGGLRLQEDARRGCGRTFHDNVPGNDEAARIGNQDVREITIPDGDLRPGGKPAQAQAREVGARQHFRKCK